MSETENQFHVFYSSMPSMQVIDDAGNPIIFVSGRFHTKDAKKIAFLQKMIADGTTSVFVRPDQLTMSDADLDPLEVLKKKHIQEYLEEQARHLNPEANVTESTQGPINAASTTDIAPVAIGGGTSALQQTMARLNAIKQNPATLVPPATPTN